MASHDTLDPASSRSTGLWASLRQLLSTSSDILHIRIEILATELEESGHRIGELLLYSLVSMLFFGLGLLLMTFFVVLAFWDTHRLAVVVGFAALYLTLGIGTALVVRHKLKTRPRLFSATLMELGKDRARLVSRS